MRKALVLAVTLVLAVVASSVALAGPDKAHHGSSGAFTIHATIPASAQLLNPVLTGNQEPAAGELLIVGGVGSFTGNGDGTIDYTVSVVSQKTQMVDAVFTFKSGTITASGLTTQQTGDPESYAITGGTGKYRGASGEIVQSHDATNDAGETFDLTFSFTGRRHR